MLHEVQRIAMESSIRYTERFSTALHNHSIKSLDYTANMFNQGLFVQCVDAPVFHIILIHFGCMYTSQLAPTYASDLTNPVTRSSICLSESPTVY